MNSSMPVLPGTEVGSVKSGSFSTMQCGGEHRLPICFSSFPPCNSFLRLWSVYQSTSLPLAHLESRLCLDIIALLWGIFHHSGKPRHHTCLSPNQSVHSSWEHVGPWRALWTRTALAILVAAGHRRGFGGTGLTLNL